MSCEQKVYEAVIKDHDALFQQRKLFLSKEIFSLGLFFIFWNLSTSAEEVTSGGLWSETDAVKQKVTRRVHWIWRIRLLQQKL